MNAKTAASGSEEESEESPKMVIFTVDAGANLHGSNSKVIKHLFMIVERRSLRSRREYNFSFSSLHLA